MLKGDAFCINNKINILSRNMGSLGWSFQDIVLDRETLRNCFSFGVKAKA